MYKNFHHCLFCKSKTENNPNVQQGILCFQRKFNINSFYLLQKKKTTKNKKEKISDRNWIDIKTEYLTMIFFAL